MKKKKNWFKYTIAFFSVFFIRLIPFRMPNVEPIMTILMPFGKVYSGFFVFLFGSLSIVLFDLVTSGLGVWTLITALAYGLVGYGASFYFKNKTGWKNYALYAVVATIFYDVITGLTVGPLFFDIPFMVALVGQIPFTIYHLLGNVSFAIVLSPVIERWILKEKEKKVFIESVVKIS